MAAEQAQPPALFLQFASGEVYEVDAMDSDTEGVPHGYAVPVPFIRSGRIFAMLESYARTHATHERGCPSAVTDIVAWDRRFMEQVRDTDTLYDIFLFGAKICLLTSFRDTCLIEIVPRDQTPTRELWLSCWCEVHYNSLYATDDLLTRKTKKKHWLF